MNEVMETMRESSKNTTVTITIEGEVLKDILIAVAGARHGGPGGRCTCTASPPDTQYVDEDDLLDDLLKHMGHKNQSQ